MAETNMGEVYRTTAEHLVALAKIVADLTEIEEQFSTSEDTLFPHLAEDASDVRHTLRLATRKLSELNQEYGMHASARLAPGDVLSTPAVIEHEEVS